VLSPERSHEPAVAEMGVLQHRAFAAPALLHSVADDHER
jgi:hypothetical protein